MDSLNYWLLVLCMTLIVFSSRYLFLEPRLPLKLSEEALRFLSYSAPAVLAAVIGPLVFLQEQEQGLQLNLQLNNPYLIGAITATLIMLVSKNTLLTAVLSMALFLLIS